MACIERTLFITRRTLTVTNGLASVTLALLLATNLGTACQSGAAANAEPTSSTPAGSQAPKARETTVLLYANMGEADEPCVCGQIIRTVRAAAGKGVRVHEIDTRDKDKQAATSQQYKIMVSPAVLILDATDKETRRFEGESSDTLKALNSELDQITKR